MRRLLYALPLLLCVLAMTVGAVQAAVPYASSLSGTVEGSRLAGVEPDGDPLYQVVMKTKLASSAGVPAANLIVSAYMENFKPDTTPVLPDLLHPKQTAQNLGGFLQGKVLLTDDAGNVLSIGSFLNEAFLDNSNHTVLTLGDVGGKGGARGKLKGFFDLSKNFTLSGRLTGKLTVDAATRRQLISRAGAKMKPLKQIINQVTVKPSHMRGKASSSASAPLNTAYTPPSASSGSSRHISPLTIAAAAGAVLSLLIAAALYIAERRRAASGAPTPSS